MLWFVAALQALGEELAGAGLLEKGGLFPFPNKRAETDVSNRLCAASTSAERNAEAASLSRGLARGAEGRLSGIGWITRYRPVRQLGE